MMQTTTVYCNILHLSTDLTMKNMQVYFIMFCVFFLQLCIEFEWCLLLRVYIYNYNMLYMFVYRANMYI